MWDGPGKSKEDWTRQPIFKLYLHSFNFLNLHATSGKRRGSVDAWNCSKLNRVFSELFCLALLAPGTYAMLMPMSAFSGEARNLGQNLQDAEPRNVICQQWYLCANIPEISIHSPALSCRSVDLAASKHDFVVLSWEIPHIGEPGKLHTVHGVTKGWTCLRDNTHTHTHKCCQAQF